MIALAAVGARVAGKFSSIVLPWWAKWLALAMLLAAVYGTGRLHEARVGQEKHAEYVAAQAKQTGVILRKQVVVVTKVDVKYRDRIQKIYVQGEQIGKAIPQYVTPADVGSFGVNAGFVRIVDAAWTGDLAGSAADTDRESAGVPLDDVAAVQAGNATSCRIWREQAYGWREFYARQQVAVNGKSGEWARAAPAGEK